jgi:Icc protein
MHILPDQGAKLAGVDPSAALDGILKAIQEDARLPDLILATGDLSQDGSPTSYQRLRTSLKALSPPVYCIPGNHDDSAQMAMHLECASVRRERRIVHGAWQIVLLDTKLPGEDRGYLDRGELEFLEGALNDNRHLHTLIGLHHGPSVICPMAMCGLENAEELLTCVKRHRNVRAVASGHAHIAHEERFGDVRAFITPSTFLYVNHPNGPAIPSEKQFPDVHRVDSNRRGFRHLELYPDGRVATEVVWTDTAL